MTPREFFNAWIGHSESETERMEAIRNITYGASRYNAANTAFSKKQAKSISKHKFPWEGGGKVTKDDIIDYDKVKGMFNMISKPADDAE